MQLCTDCITQIIAYLNFDDIYNFLQASKIIRNIVGNIKKLTIKSNSYTNNCLPFYKNVESIKIIINNCNYILIDNLSKIRFKQLKEIIITVNPYNNIVNDLNKYRYFISSRKFIHFITINDQIERITINNSYSISDFTILFILKRCKNLKYINVDNCNCLTELSLTKINKITVQ